MKHTEKTQPNFVFETKYWEAYLNSDQYYLGRLVMVAKRDVGNMSDLSDNEWLDFAQLVRKVEAALKKAFGATMYNWTCLLNDAYKNNPPNPHVHWHVRPRYSKAVNFEGIEFEDKEFGHHYARGTGFEVPKKVFQKIIEKIKKSL